MKKAIVTFAAFIAALMMVFSNTPLTSYAARYTSANGTTTYGNTKVTIDASNISDGYVSIKYTGSNDHIKIRIIKDTTYTYDVKTVGSYEVFPLTEGNGTYQIKIYEHSSGTSYTVLYSTNINVSLKDQLAPFLLPNQFVNYKESSACVALAAQICTSADTLENVKAVYDYVVTNISYDDAKAASVQSGYLPNIDETISTGKGICFDYAALMTAMLRSREIPCKLVVGYAGTVYHAWINVYTQEQGWINSAIYFDGTTWKLMDPTYASTGGQSAEVMAFIGDGAHYQAKYTY